MCTFCCLLLPQVWAWGRGEHGRLGFGEDKTIKAVPHLVMLLEGETIVQVRVSKILQLLKQYTTVLPREVAVGAEHRPSSTSDCCIAAGRLPVAARTLR